MTVPDLPQVALAPAAALDTVAAAKYVGVHPITLARWRSHGDGPAYVRMGRNGRIRYSIEALDRFLTEGTVDPSKAAA